MFEIEPFLALGRIDEALESFEYAVKVVPNRVSAWLCLACLYFDLGRNEDALRAAEQFTTSQPALVWEAHLALGLEPTVQPREENIREVLVKSWR